MTNPEENVPANDAAVFYLGSPPLAGGSRWEPGGRVRIAGGAREGVARWHRTLISNDLPPIGAEARPSR